MTENTCISSELYIVIVICYHSCPLLLPLDLNPSLHYLHPSLALFSLFTGQWVNRAPISTSITCDNLQSSLSLRPAFYNSYENYNIENTAWIYPTFFGPWIILLQGAAAFGMQVRFCLCFGGLVGLGGAGFIWIVLTFTTAATVRIFNIQTAARVRYACFSWKVFGLYFTKLKNVFISNDVPNLQRKRCSSNS